MEKWDIIVKVVTDLLGKVRFVLSNLTGWAFMLMTYIFATFGDKAKLIHWVLIVLVLDLIFGIWSSMKMGKFKISTALWSTAVKLVIYVTLFFMPMILEKIVHQDTVFCTIAVTSLLCTAEFFSIIAHMLIIKPNLVGIRLIYRLLAGEIAKKLNMSEEEFEEYLHKHNLS